MRETGETVTLSVADLVTILAQVEAQAGIRTFHAPGSTLPMHGSALGKALLAQAARRPGARHLDAEPRPG